MLNGRYVSLPTEPTLQGKAVFERFGAMLTGYGLTGPEADGLVAAWTPQFFQTPGRRFLLRMSPTDYDLRCPMQMRPARTELVRLGLVLSEFDQPGAENTGEAVERSGGGK